MIDWLRGVLGGSLLRLARQEVCEHLRKNPAARRVRYRLGRRVMRGFFSIGRFGSFVWWYIIIDSLVLGMEAFIAGVAPSYLRTWTAFPTLPTTDIESLLLSVSGYFLAAQAGALGVITLALALVTLIAQRESSATDIEVYYHESMAFQVVASSLALLAVLATQLLWPLQGLLHRFDRGSDNLIFEFFLLGIHLLWLLMNLVGIAYFIETTFRFVQQSKRELLRERYTANIVYQRELEQRLCETRYKWARMVGVGEDGPCDPPRAFFGSDTKQPAAVEISKEFPRATSLQDVRMIWVRWVFRRWSKRCREMDEKRSHAEEGLGLPPPGPIIYFTPRIFQPVQGKVDWCRRQGGVPLTAFEKSVLRRSFVFGKARNED